MTPCMKKRHIRFVDEPSLGLSDTDFVHCMWGDDETYEPTDDDSDDDYEDTDSVYSSDSLPSDILPLDAIFPTVGRPHAE